MITANAKQTEAIESPADNCVVIAGPGTGKSKVLLWRAKYLVNQLSIPAASIVMASFTNPSVNDLRDTIELPEFADAKGVRMHTFHSLALRCLLRMAGRGSYVFIADDWEEANLIDPYLKNALGLSRVDTAAKRRRDYDARWCQATENPEEWLSLGERQEFHRAFTAVRQALDFTTIGELTYRWWLALSSEPAATNTDLGIDFAHIIVDEYQDLNECEHETLQLLGRRGISVFVSVIQTRAFMGVCDTLILNSVYHSESVSKALIASS